MYSKSIMGMMDRCLDYAFAAFVDVAVLLPRRLIMTNT
jgi:hypothetical protein